MTIFTFKEDARIKEVFFLFILSLIIIVPCTPVNAQNATDIYTDFGGFWKSSVTNINTVLPNKSHNVVGYTFGGVTYSTGVNDALLTQNSIIFTTGNYKTLPFTSISGSIPSSNSSIYIALAEQYDGVAAGYSSPLPSVKVKDALTDGINGLNIGTGVTDLPSSANMIFPAQIISTAAITDDQPDIIFAQLTSAATSADVLVFQDSTGKTVGKSNSVQWNLVKTVGNQSLDFYNLNPGALIDTAKIVSGFSSNTTQSMRLLTMHLSDFGITAANASQVKALVIKPAGSSDPAFIAYNTQGIYIISPIINTQPQSQVICTGTGQGATFSVNATGLSLTYQWMKNGVNIPGAVNATYNIPVVTSADIAGYQVVVTNGGGVQYSSIAYLNTAITKQPSPAAQTVVTGNTVVFSVSANNTTSFQWRRNGVNISGATDSVYTINPVTTTDSGSYTVSAINTGGSGCATIVSTPVSLTPVIKVYSKSTGNINLPVTWGANTDGSGSTPVDFTRAEHTFVLSNRASGNTLTNLTIAGTLDVKDGIAIISNSTTLDVGKCIRSGTGSITGSPSGGLKVNGTSFLYFTPGSQVLKDFTIAGGTVTMLSPLVISGDSLPGKLNLTAGTLALAGNKITLRSTSETNTSMVTAVGATATITYGTGGAFVAERYIPANRSYRFMSPPVTTTTSVKTNWMEGVVNPDPWTFINPLPGYGTHITGTKGAADSLDPTMSNNPSMFYFNKTNQSWVAATNSTTTLTAGYPVRLMIRGSRAVNLLDNEAASSTTTLRTTGSLVTGTYTVGSDLLSSTIGRYSFIGNPYACPVNWNTITKTGVTSTYYAWDQKINKRGGYVAYNGTSETNSSGSFVNENIQSGQGFFVLTSSTTPMLQFKETDKTTINTKVFRESSVLPKLTVDLFINNLGEPATMADGLTLIFKDEFSKEIGDEDSYKFSNLDENFSIDHNGTALSIEGRPTVTDKDTISLKLSQLRQKNYLFKISPRNFSPGLTAFIKDNYLNIQTPFSLEDVTTIPFGLTSDSMSFSPNRFSMVFNYARVLSLNVTDLTGSLTNEGIQLKWISKTEANVDYYEVEKFMQGLFKTIATETAKNNNSAETSNHFLDYNYQPGHNFYRIKIVEKSGEIKYTNVVKVEVAAKSAALSIYPNPVKGNVMHIATNIVEQGTYNVTINSINGKGVFKSTIVLPMGASSQKVSINKSLTAGLYHLRLSKNDVVLQSLMIVQ